MSALHSTSALPAGGFSLNARHLFPLGTRASGDGESGLWGRQREIVKGIVAVPAAASEKGTGT
jgi:hypothetical protein